MAQKFDVQSCACGAKPVLMEEFPAFGRIFCVILCICGRHRFDTEMKKCISLWNDWNVKNDTRVGSDVVLRHSVG